MSGEVLQNKIKNMNMKKREREREWDKTWADAG